MLEKRARLLKKGIERKGPVIYWMSREQRVSGNWALIYAANLAEKSGSPLYVVFCMAARFLDAAIRQYSFMIEGLKETEKSLARQGIPFFMLQGNPGEKIPSFVEEHSASLLVADFDPLKIKQLWKKQVVEKIRIPLYEVDAHNIVPCWLASQKQEFGAYTIRPKLKRLLPDFLTEHPQIVKFKTKHMHKNNWDAITKKLDIDFTIKEAAWLRPGEKAASEMLDSFIKERLNNYLQRNDPNNDSQSNLSPYLHFGHISSQAAALEVMDSKAGSEAKEAFLEELIIRKELADNFCFYNANYDSFEGLPEWGKKTLDEHRKDTRPYLYSQEEMENAKTHDELWNAAQLEMANTGKMHNYMRMYWAKKILEWTKSPEEAISIAIYLNDKYELDGRDPNGYTGILWSIGGLHDRPWAERQVFGKVRYMSYNGCRLKFDINSYIKKQKTQ